MWLWLLRGNQDVHILDRPDSKPCPLRSVYFMKMNVVVLKKRTEDLPEDVRRRVSSTL